MKCYNLQLIQVQSVDCYHSANNFLFYRDADDDHFK